MTFSPRTRRLVLSIVLLALGGIAYGGYFAVQSMLGREALKETQLVSLPLADALERAAREGKLVLVDVAAIWCPTCRRLDREVFAHPDVRRRIATDFVFSRLEYDSAEGRAFHERVGAAGFPTLWLVAPDGAVARRLDLTFEPRAFLAQLESALPSLADVRP